MANLLFIDDDTDISAINAKFFSKEGHTVKIASTAKKGIALLKTFLPDCIILDVMMPEQNGFDTCREIRTFSTAPIIFLSGCTTEDDRIKGLMIGADDYIIKPYSFRELSARIQVQLRRHIGNSNPSFLSYPPLSLDLRLHKAFYNKEEIQLSNREYELLYLLVSHPNQTVTFKEIGVSMWENYLETDRRTIMVTASRLRKKLEGYPNLVNIIETVWSKGYKFIAK
jgi:DNA-binding response OmpR family regulator